MQDLQTAFNGQRLLIEKLPTLPQALQEAMRLADMPHTSATQLSAVIMRDQALASSVLKMVNSPFYGFPGRIGSIRNALVLLGFNVVRNLIIATVAFEGMLGNMTALWRHSVGCSIACGKLGHLLHMGDIEELVLAGLLHDIGKAVVAAQLPEAKREIGRLVDGRNLTSWKAEQEVLGIDHARIGAWFAEHWHLPARLRHAIAFHHNPTSTREYRTIASVVHLGDFLTRLFEIGNGEDDHVPLLDTQAFEHLGLYQRLNRHQLAIAIDAIGEKFEQERLASMWQASDRQVASPEVSVQKIPLHQAKAGMVLVYGVMTDNGKILAAADEPVDDAMLLRLERAGVTKLVVRGKPVPGTTIGYDAQTRAVRLGHLFRAYPDDKFMILMKTQLLKHFKERA